MQIDTVSGLIDLIKPCTQVFGEFISKGVNLCSVIFVVVTVSTTASMFSWAALVAGRKKGDF